jgi:hypothetical protein
MSIALVPDIIIIIIIKIFGIHGSFLWLKDFFLNKIRCNSARKLIYLLYSAYNKGNSNECDIF